MKRIKSNLVFVAAMLTGIYSNSQTKKVDLLICNARIYTVDSSFSVAEAMAVSNGKIVATGTSAGLKSSYTPDKTIDASGKFIYPGLIDAHAHFYRYGLGLQSANLVGSTSWEQVISILRNFARSKKIQPGHWIIGRGWDQNDWAVKEFPSKEKLDRYFPNYPVILTRIDGHASIANQRAMDLAGIKAGQKIEGGLIEVKNGKLTGILIDNAMSLVNRRIPQPTALQVTESLREGQQNCFSVGLTTVDDCGIDYQEALFMDSLQKKNILKMRVYAMLSDARPNYEFLFSNGKIKTERLNVRAFKVYADGALGSRGACLLDPYSDRAGWYGFLLSSQKHFDSVAKIIYENGFQMCTHAIGDSANRTILNIYARYLKGNNDLRWRIEHAQVVDEHDFSLFGRHNIIPSVQPTHATSDMYWAEKRVGPKRIKGVYAYRQLMEQNGWIPLGTDFPVEDISPFKTFYAAVFRVDGEDWPQGGFLKENALNRQQALRGMTIWAARSNFEEKEKGSLEPGKFADFIILDKDLMTIEHTEVLKTNVLATYVGGEKVYEKK